MSDSDILPRYAERIASERSELDPRFDSELWDDLGCFGWLRGQRERAAMIELRKRDGNILAVGYGWLEKIAFDPSDGITLYLAGQTIRIAGRNLNVEIRPGVRLFEGMTRHRIPWLREVARGESLRSPEGACVVESIMW